MDPDGSFGEDVASRYDETSAEMFDPAILSPAVEFLAARAKGGRVLELGIGTGRVALPLAARGLEVHGIELSQAMLRRLQAKTGAEQIGVTLGDFSTTRVEGGESRFSLAYVVWNTIMNLTSQRAQAACFRNVAWHLASGGWFVVEVQLPDLQRLPFGETIRPFRLTAERLGFDEYDIATQRLTSHHFFFEDGRVSRDSTPFRYVWPSELDLMAELAGLRPVERWSNWRGEAFNSRSERIVAVWEKAT